MNFFDVEVRRNPYPLYERMRKAAPVLHNPQANLWMLFDYESVKRAVTDSETFCSSMEIAGRGSPPWLIFFDPPRHTRLRALIARAFTPRMIASLETRIQALSRQLLDDVIEQGEMDLAADFAVPLPMKVIAGMIGVPPEDWPRFRHWSDVILKLSYAVSENAEMATAVQEYGAVTAEMRAYLPDLIEQRRTHPTDDLLTCLIEAEVDGERLTAEEILGFFQMLLVAGHETTTNLINNAILCLLENPEQFACLQATPDLLPAAIEEVLRYRSPVQWLFRATKNEVEMGETVIPAGQLVLAMVGSANRDPRQFSEPERFDIMRTPNLHIAFGYGIHFCLGAALSRLEARIALGDLLGRAHGLRRASLEPWEPRKALHVHGPNSLPIRFAPGRRLGT